VFASVVLQLISAAAYAPAIGGILASDYAQTSRATRVGCVLLCLGAMGSAADAVFHLVAFEMTAPGADLETMAPVMKELQGPDLLLLSPFVAAFFAAHVTIVMGRRRHDAVARAAFWVLLTVPALVVLGAMARSMGALSGRVVGLMVLGATSGSLALVGISFARQRQGPQARCRRGAG
jgi:hypothetical protein